MNHSTGKERDAETGLDYFGARYYSGAQGRFLGADPITVTPARMADPQQLNLYAYTRNNPLKYIDPTGMYIDTRYLNDKDLEQWEKMKELAYQKDSKGNWVNPNLQAAYDLLDSDDRTFVIMDSKLESGEVGKYDTIEMSDTDYAGGTIQIDFQRVNSLSKTSPASMIPGFNQFEGILNNKTAKLAEVFGHEAGHAIFGLSNRTEEIISQKAVDAYDNFMATRKKNCPIPPDISEKLKASAPYVNDSE
jgi:RHS repeat-associated protein